MSRSQNCWRLVFASTVLLSLALIVAVAVALNAARTSLLAEKNLQGFLHAYRATLEHVQDNDGQWPRSWDDLRVVQPQSDFESVAEQITFDFHADPRKIVSQTPATFTAIQPRQPCYPVDHHVQQLIDSLANYHAPY